MIRIFTDLSLLAPKECGVELLGVLDPSRVDIDNFPGRRGRYDRLLTAEDRGFEFVSNVHDCDYALLPFGWNKAHADAQQHRTALNFISRARDHGKKTLVFYWSDNDEDLSLDSAIVLRTSLYRSRRGPFEYAMPAWSEDFAQYFEGLSLRKKASKATVGFCGFAHSRDLKSTARTLLRVLKRLRNGNKPFFSPSGYIRRVALDSLKRSLSVQANFLIRQHFGGKQPAGDIQQRDAVLLKNRLDFVNNTLESDYVLCCRGAGNFSYRLYETMSCGRIPIVIDTDIVLPFESTIPWDDFILRVRSEDVAQIGKLVDIHYSEMPQNVFEGKQKLAREAWEKYIEPSSYFRQLSESLRTGYL